ncbi:MAG: hypothetical protein ACWGOW_04730 [Gammaproteobacteria bacterium]
MKTGSKVLISSVLIIVIALAAALYYVWTSLDSLVEAAIEKYGSQVTQTAVQVQEVKLQKTLAQGKGSIAGISVANPQGFSTPYAFTLGQIQTKIDITTITQSPVVIDEIVVAAQQMFFEVNNERKVNFNVLKNNINRAIPTKPASQQTKTKTPETEIKIIIRRLLIQDGKVEATVIPLDKQLTTRVPRIELRNLGGKGGGTPAEIAKQVLDVVIDRTRAAVSELGIEQQLKDAADQKIAEEKAKLKTRADEQVETEKQKAEDKLKKLLGQ